MLNTKRFAGRGDRDVGAMESTFEDIWEGREEERQGGEEGGRGGVLVSCFGGTEGEG
ncbi:hypothetical protein LINPERPRIM_LOCUS8607 [Linum perenne]